MEELHLVPELPLADEVEASYPVAASELIWQGLAFGLREDKVTLPGDEKPVTRQYLDHPGAVAVVALKTPPESHTLEILLLEQYRHPVRRRLWEIPAGLLDVEGEPPLQTARRELREEADLGAHEWSVLVDLYTSPGASAEALRIYLATELYHYEEAYPRAEEEAHLVPRWVGLRDAVAAVFAGQIHSPTAVTGILAVWAKFTDPGIPLRPPETGWFAQK